MSHNRNPGHPGHTTPEQDAAVLQLRTELEKEGYKERLDTCTLVPCHIRFCMSSVRGARVADLLVFFNDSYDSSEQGSSILRSPRRCKLCRLAWPDAGRICPESTLFQKLTTQVEGSFLVRNGGQSSRWTRSLRTLFMWRNRRSLNTILNSTTRSTR